MDGARRRRSRSLPATRRPECNVSCPADPGVYVRCVWDGSRSSGLGPHGLASAHGSSQEKRRRSRAHGLGSSRDRPFWTAPGPVGAEAHMRVDTQRRAGVRRCRLDTWSEGEVLSKHASVKQELVSTSTHTAITQVRSVRSCVVHGGTPGPSLVLAQGTGRTLRSVILSHLERDSRPKELRTRHTSERRRYEGRRAEPLSWG